MSRSSYAGESTQELFERYRALRRTQELLARAEVVEEGIEPFVPDLLPHQIPPPQPWGVWLLQAGRGAGKTLAAAKYVDDHMNGPPCYPGPGGHRIAIIAPTLGDASESCVNSPGGLKAINPLVREVTTKGGTYVRWPSGAVAKLFGAYTPEDIERLRAGGGRCLAWLEELAAWRFLRQCWEQMEFGLRLGPNPHVVASTTPKPSPMLKQIRGYPRTVVTRAATKDNPHLPPARKQELYDRYANTRLGAQELEGEEIEDVEGALWTSTLLEADRVDTTPDLVRVVVGVDPAATATETSADTGIVVAGLGRDGHAYVLADSSCHLSPAGWGARVVGAYETWEADKIVPETNNGGEMVTHVIRTVDDTVPVDPVHATRGKQTRAEPISALYEQRRVHHVGRFPDLEVQMTTWVPGEADSPDRLDALVWALTALMLGRKHPRLRYTA